MMSTTQSFKSLALNVSAVGVAATIVLTGADSAKALTFNLDANVYSSRNLTTKIGKVTGKFDYDSTSGLFNNINLKSTATGLTYTGLDSGLPSSGKEVWFSSPAPSLFFGSVDSVLKLVFNSDLKGAKSGDVISLFGGKSLNSIESPEIPIGPGLSLAFPIEGSVSAQAVPTPALLPGLIGMGVAALRKRQAASEEAEA